jgi:hypothetical protein
MQTSFMHPPFGFALFYLRSVAPAKDYVDKVTGKLMAKVTTGQIYWGAVPFVVIQVIMVAIVLTFPGLVMHYKEGQSTVDPSKVQIEVESIDGPGGEKPGEGASEDPIQQMLKQQSEGADKQDAPDPMQKMLEDQQKQQSGAK